MVTVQSKYVTCVFFYVYSIGIQLIHYKCSDPLTRLHADKLQAV